eukprot:CAMPEP_0198202934 /NCGR_PEP_ID=MMETSP1445-20131203/6156_1 /TAXON_ID=36898 /ORGANISM="Pyramimonas sp., Strain CCMP2087" /LENGTH=370 /DNA_ID=CAMNT_0043874089 /DNA_START=151 /DNA_END=1263 /DNA_ORIENTATION=-
MAALSTVSTLLVAPTHTSAVHSNMVRRPSRAISKCCRHSQFGTQTTRLVEKRMTPAAVAPRQQALRKHGRQQIVKVSNAAARSKVSVEDGDIVKVHFIGRLEDGTIFEDTTRRADPISFKIGADQMMAGVEKAVMGMTVGEILTVSCLPEDAFGDYDEDSCFEVPIERAPEGLALGHVRLFDGPATCRCTKITETDFTLDLNHELAGKIVSFELTLLEAVDPLARFPVRKTDEEWRLQLPTFAYQVLRLKGTEPAGAGEYDKFYPKTGYFTCGGCDQPLYSAAAKFDSECGWPAFDKCFKDSIVIEMDDSEGMKRAEIMCSNCGGHLGHVFEGEEKTPTNERHCVNSVSVKYVDKPIAYLPVECKAMPDA